MENNNINEHDYVKELLQLIRSDLPREQLAASLDDYHENDIAGALEQLTDEERKALYPLLGEDRISEIFTYLEDVDEYMSELGIIQQAKIIENMDSDDAVDILEEMDEDTQKVLTQLLDEETSADIRLIQSYDEDEIGSLITTNFIEIKNTLTIQQAMNELVKQAGDNDNISTIYVSDKNGKYYGAIDLKDLICARKNTALETLISTSYPYLNDHESITDSLEDIKDYKEDSLPVLNKDREIIGIITSQDVVEIIDDEMGEDYARLAGLTAEEDLHEPLKDSIKKRMPWLITLLFLGMLVSSVMGMFEVVVASVALVVCFQSLILDMAGNVGTQSLAVTIRVLMDENLTAGKKVKLVLKEMRVGFVNGLILGAMSCVFVGCYIHFFKQQTWNYAFGISLCVGAALILAMVISSLVGTVVPMFFHKIKVDPAVASGPLITTVNDLVAVITYYGLAWLFLVRFM